MTENEWIVELTDDDVQFFFASRMEVSEGHLLAKSGLYGDGFLLAAWAPQKWLRFYPAPRPNETPQVLAGRIAVFERMLETETDDLVRYGLNWNIEKLKQRLERANPAPDAGDAA